MPSNVAKKDVREQGARFLLVAACLVVVIAGLKAAASVVLPFLIAIFLAMISLPLLNWLQANRIPRPLAVGVTIVVSLAALSGVAVLLGTSIRRFTAQVPKYKARLEVIFANLLDFLREQGFDLSDPLAADLIDPGRAFDLITGTLRGTAAVLSNLLLVLLAVIFILFEAAGFPDKLRAAFGHRESSERFNTMRYEVQHYLGIKTLVSLTTGAIVAAAMALIGVDFALLWGFLAFLLNYIPAFGSILAAIPPVLLAIVQFGFGRALIVALVFIAVNVVFGNFLEPYLMGRQLGLSTLVVFSSLLFWGWVWGPVGMLLSVPLTMIVKIMLENTEDLRWVAVLLGAGPPRSERTPGD
jgi:predicted PurR-regulated permease PerM